MLTSAVFQKYKNKKKNERERREILTLRNYYFSPEHVIDSKLSQNMPKYLVKRTPQNNFIPSMFL